VNVGGTEAAHPSLPEDRDVRLLFVCTANQCRSPMAAALGTRLVHERGIRVEIASAGLLPGGVPAAKGAARALRRLGLDLSGHRSRTVDPGVLEWSDLVLTMERRHVVELAGRDASILRHLFTLREFTALLGVLGPRNPAVPPIEWIERAHGLRPTDQRLPVDAEDDIVDPMGRSARAFRQTAEELDGQIRLLLTLLFPSDGADA
jgi:protein-tyrosine phosphatase